MRVMTIQIDPLTGSPRLVAPHRAERLVMEPGRCPFCVGHEASTPAPTGERRDPATGEWTARSVPNRYPLTDPHEVLIATPRHVTSWRGLQRGELGEAVSLLLERRVELAAAGRYVHAFANDGLRAGASLEHAHAQLVVVEHAYGARLTARLHGRDCALCVLVATNVAAGLHVAQVGEFMVFAHPSPRLAGGLIVAPTTHRAEPDQSDSQRLAHALEVALAAVDPDLDLNFWLAADRGDTHWYLEVQPRTANLAGVELALGLNVATADPRATAAAAHERVGFSSR
jgi:UDPglucose--hexose-1-phosphate uridylyltransferase